MKTSFAIAVLIISISCFSQTIKSISPAEAYSKCLDFSVMAEKRDGNIFKKINNNIISILPSVPEMGSTLCDSVQTIEQADHVINCYENAPKDWMLVKASLCGQTLNKEEAEFSKNCFLTQKSIMKHDFGRGDVCGYSKKQSEIDEVLACLKLAKSHVGYYKDRMKCISEMVARRQIVKATTPENELCEKP